MVSFRQAFHGGREDGLHLPLSGQNIGVQVVVGGEFGNALIFVFRRAAGSGKQADHAKFDRDLTPSRDIHSHFFGNFLFGWISFHRGGQFAGDLFETFVPFAKVAGRPVHVAKAVEDRAFDAVFGIALKGDLFVVVVLERGVEQAEYARVNQIVEFDMHGKVFIDPDGNGADEGQVLQDQPVSFALCPFRGFCLLGNRGGQRGWEVSRRGSHGGVRHALHAGGLPGPAREGSALNRSG